MVLRGIWRSTHSSRKESSIMRSANDFASKLTSWELLTTNVEPLLGEMPHLWPFFDHLRDLGIRGRDLDAQQESARALLRELTRMRQDVERDGENMRARL